MIFRFTDRHGDTYRYTIDQYQQEIRTGRHGDQGEAEEEGRT